MGSIANYLEDQLLGHLCNTAFTPATGLFLALCTADPTDAATGASMSEVPNTNGYARTAITFGAAATRRVTQNAAVTFPQATGAWPTISHWAIVSSGTYGAGNVYAHGSFLASFTPVAGNAVTIASGQCYVEFTASTTTGFTNYLVHKWLDLAFRNVAFSKPNTYAGLASAILDDTDAAIGDITELSGNAYARKQINPNGGASPTWTVVSGGALDNAHDVDFPTPTGTWAAFTSWFLIDSSSGAGNVMAFGNDIVDQPASTGDRVFFPVGALDLAVS